MNEGRIGQACDSLGKARGRMDGEPSPPDFIQGCGVSEILFLIDVTMDTIGCT